MKKLKAFTLIELLVVIAIIALLLSILMPSLTKAKDQARKIVCQNHLKTIGLGEMMYSEASDDWHLPAFYWNEPRDPEAKAAMWFKNPLFITLVEMKGSHNKEDELDYAEKSDTLPKKYKCPSDKRTIANGGLHIEAGETIQGVSYAMNMMNIRPMGTWFVKNRVWALKVDQIRRPADKIFFMDGQWFVVYRDGAEYKRVWDVYGDKMGAWEWDSASYRHDEGANITFYDGHVAYWKKEKICPYPPGMLEQLRARNRIWMPIPGPDEFFRQ